MFKRNDVRRKVKSCSKKHLKDNYLSTKGGIYHRRWHRFTESLRELMEENPFLPVVVLSSGEDVNCRVGYVHNLRTGNPVEKIIAIYNPKESFAETVGGDFISPLF